MESNGKIFSSQRSTEDQDLLERSTKKSKVYTGDPAPSAMDIVPESMDDPTENGSPRAVADSQSIPPVVDLGAEGASETGPLVEVVLETQPLLDGDRRLEGPVENPVVEDSGRSIPSIPGSRYAHLDLEPGDPTSEQMTEGMEGEIFIHTQPRQTNQPGNPTVAFTSNVPRGNQRFAELRRRTNMYILLTIHQPLR
nr:hypothetical protein Itr_chr03CG11310 [Ipomoea trifida]